MCDENKTGASGGDVPDFETQGFTARAGAADTLAAAHAKIANLKALKLSVCVGGGYNPATNKVCFSIPIYGDLRVTSPVHIPVGGAIKVCAETCGSIIPTGLRATVYVNNTKVFSVTVFGPC